MLEHSYYSVISPEGCAAILWKDLAAASKAAEALKITADDLGKLGLVDGVILEPVGGAHNDPDGMARLLKERLIEEFAALDKLSPAARLRQRYQKFRAYAGFPNQKPLRWPGTHDLRRNLRIDLQRRGGLSELYPLFFHPLFKERIWGGRMLEQLYGKRVPAGKIIGESWEIADRPGESSVVANGPLAGTSLRSLMEARRNELLGDARDLAGRFPLLIKILDARQTLSVQVHPPAAKALALGGEAKTEMWYVADAAPRRGDFCGFEARHEPRRLRASPARRAGRRLRPPPPRARGRRDVSAERAGSRAGGRLRDF